MGTADHMSKHFNRVNSNRIQPVLDNWGGNDRALPGPQDHLATRHPGYGEWVPAESMADSSHSNLFEYWNKLRKRKFAILACIAVGVLGGLIFSLFQTPLYRAVPSLEVDDLNENFQNLKDQDPTSGAGAAESYFQTQIKVLQSRDMLERV